MPEKPKGILKRKNAFSHASKVKIQDDHTHDGHREEEPLPQPKSNKWVQQVDQADGGKTVDPKTQKVYGVKNIHGLFRALCGPYIPYTGLHCIEDPRKDPVQGDQDHGVVGVKAYLQDTHQLGKEQVVGPEYYYASQPVKDHGEGVLFDNSQAFAVQSLYRGSFEIGEHDIGFARHEDVFQKGACQLDHQIQKEIGGRQQHCDLDHVPHEEEAELVRGGNILPLAGDDEGPLVRVEIGNGVVHHEEQEIEFELGDLRGIFYENVDERREADPQDKDDEADGDVGLPEKVHESLDPGCVVDSDGAI